MFKKRFTGNNGRTAVGMERFAGIMGASGSGKTTLLNLLSTIDCVTAGHIFYDNIDITEMKEDVKDLYELKKRLSGEAFVTFIEDMTEKLDIFLLNNHISNEEYSTVLKLMTVKNNLGIVEYTTLLSLFFTIIIVELKFFRYLALLPFEIYFFTSIILYASANFFYVTHLLCCTLQV